MVTPATTSPPAAKRRKLDLSGLFESGRFSDLLVKCRDHVYRVHRGILAEQCNFFSKALEGFFKEAITGEIDLSDDHPSGVKAMMEFFYTADYTVSSPKPESTLDVSSKCEYHIHVYAVATKYDLVDLQSLAVGYFDESLSSLVDHNFLPVAIELIYKTSAETFRGLRDKISQFIQPRYESLKKTGVLDDVMRQNAAFSRDMFLLAQAAILAPRSFVQCSNCTYNWAPQQPFKYSWSYKCPCCSHPYSPQHWSERLKVLESKWPGDGSGISFG